MLNRDKQLFVSILKNFVQGVPFQDDTVTTEEWVNLMNLASIHSDVGIIAYMMKMYPSQANAPLKDLIRSTLMNSVIVFANRAELMKVLIDQMNEENIDHLLFKGFVVRNLYPEPELRSFSDIDFLIHSEDRERMHQLMLKNDFKVQTDFEPVYSYLKGIEYYEIHTHVMEIDVSDKADYVGYYKKIWNHAYCTCGCSYELDKEFHLIYLLTHIAKHINSSGAGIRMYVDIAFYLKAYRDEINWDHFCDEIKLLHFEDFVNIVFSAVQEWFGVGSPIKLKSVEPDVLDDFLNFTLDGGLFGKVGRNGGETWLKREDRNNDQNISKARTIIKRVFPSAYAIEPRYTYLKGKHWLLPIAWIHRLILTRGKLGEHAVEAKQIMNADEEKILKMRKIYKQIGL